MYGYPCYGYGPAYGGACCGGGEWVWIIVVIFILFFICGFGPGRCC